MSSERIEPKTHVSELPEIIQGGMGFGVSNWEIAGEVAKHHELGVVSGTATGMLLHRRLQDGDTHSRDILLEKFPDKDAAEAIVENSFIDGGKELFKEYTQVPMLSHKANPKAELMNLAGSFVEVALAKKMAGGNGKIGINMLTKLEEPTLSALYGAMLADVDVVIMGAGIPRDIPRALDDLAGHEVASIPLTVTGKTKNYRMSFNPQERYPKLAEQDLSRPNFLAIVSAESLAKRLSRQSSPPNGFVVEHHTAGGHNAPPRDKHAFKESGEPLYDAVKDEPDFDAFNELAVPYWLAGRYGSPEKLAEARAIGASGIQAGSVFALTRESGLAHEIKISIVKRIMSGEDVDVFTDPLASPTGFPFKVAQIGDTISVDENYKNRVRICDLGYLREKYEKPNGDIGYRCASEPLKDYERKSGDLSETTGRKCLCNALAATIDMPQYRKDKETLEPRIVTLGDDVNRVVRLMFKQLTEDKELYTAKDVLDYLRSSHNASRTANK